MAEICKLVDEVVLVSEEEMLSAIRHLREKEGVDAEPAGAAATAAFRKTKAEPCRVVVLLMTGANISPEVRRTAFGDNE